MADKLTRHVCSHRNPSCLLSAGHDRVPSSHSEFPGYTERLRDGRVHKAINVTIQFFRSFCVIYFRIRKCSRGNTPRHSLGSRDHKSTLHPFCSLKPGLKEDENEVPQKRMPYDTGVTK
ncbi:hypothetical protein J6590_046388 [Homalodisca vitripennis]|nr:hypothetical protein J6590_046388 [Homalodisca vitripennis]